MSLRQIREALQLRFKVPRAGSQAPSTRQYFFFIADELIFGDYLNKTNLEEGTLANAKLQLTSHAAARDQKKSSIIDTGSVSKVHLDEVLKIYDKLKKVNVPLRESGSTAADCKKTLSDFRSQII